VITQHKPLKLTHSTKEEAFKRTVELVMARCLRPDLINLTLHNLLALIYDFNYSSFKTDVLVDY
jgi:hypothetical protein